MAARLLPLLVWLFPILFFAYQFVLRLFPGLVMPDLMAFYQVNATDFGWLASVYYFGYAGMQIPIAILLDHYSPRWVIFGCVCLCSIGAFLMVTSTSWPLALLSRFLIGVGSAAGFLGTSKVISQWFPPHWYGRMVGFSFTLGLIGAIFGGKPVSLLIEQWGWQDALVGLAWLALVLALAIAIIVRKPHHSAQEIKTDVLTWGSFKSVFTNRAILWLAFANLLMVGALEGFADVWGVSYFMTIHDLEKPEAAGLTSLIFLGMIFGGPILGFIAEKFNRYYSVTAFCALAMSAIFASILMMGPALSLWMTKIFMFLTGVFCCYQVVVFAIGARMVPLGLISVAVAFLNCINMFGGSFFHTVIGRLMDWRWIQSGIMAEGVPVYSESHYVFALAVIPLAAFFGALGVGVASWQGGTRVS